MAVFAAAWPWAVLGSVQLADLRAQDERLARIAEPILAANVKLCDRTMPDLGVTLQSIDQYLSGAKPDFAAPVAFAVVLPGSAAALAGITRDDGLVTIDGQPIARRADHADGPLSDSAFVAIAEHDPQAPLALGIIHHGVRRTVTIPTAQECRAEVELLLNAGDNAGSGGDVIQVDYGLATETSDLQLAAVFAHELAHSILHHHDRLVAAHVDMGVFSEFGRNRRLIRQTEVAADRLSVHLLANAGIDPRVAPQLWRSAFGRKLNGGLFHSQAYPSAMGRAELLESEIAQYHLVAGVWTYPAALLATRNRPLN